MIRELCTWVKSVYTIPSVETIALRELEESHRELLRAQSSREYADLLCKYCEARIERLTVYLRELQNLNVDKRKK